MSAVLLATPSVDLAGAVAGVDGVVDAAAGFLLPVGDGELAGGPPDGLGGALL